MSSAKIYVTRQLPEAALSLLKNCGEMRVWEPDEVIPRAVLLREVEEIVALLCMVTERIDAELLAHASELRIVANMGSRI